MRLWLLRLPYATHTPMQRSGGCSLHCWESQTRTPLDGLLSPAYYQIVVCSELRFCFAKPMGMAWAGSTPSWFSHPCSLGCCQDVSWLNKCQVVDFSRGSLFWFNATRAVAGDNFVGREVCACLVLYCTRFTPSPGHNRVGWLGVKHQVTSSTRYRESVVYR